MVHSTTHKGGREAPLVSWELGHHGEATAEGTTGTTISLGPLTMRRDAHGSALVEGALSSKRQAIASRSTSRTMGHGLLHDP
ncbi:hypothetical protein H5410_046742 [Solanum commersonii]|uniref:Uncharacterized protein n=1 Tax=Solanum commersonii TaxID=4109 RepID=A0A9J5XGC7_SOLCO|nr:hypothetical protein H5410_046742 [Solanum commersonii]